MRLAQHDLSVDKYTRTHPRMGFAAKKAQTYVHHTDSIDFDQEQSIEYTE